MGVRDTGYRVQDVGVLVRGVWATGVQALGSMGAQVNELSPKTGTLVPPGEK